MNSLFFNSKELPLSRAMRLREAVLLTFCDPPPAECALLMHLSHEEWKGLLHWLDTSGMALYFLDRLVELGQDGMLPTVVLARLKENLADNTERIHQMIAESVAIQRRFQEAGLSYAVVKGFSLWPLSVPKLELRSQLDQDFQVAEESAGEAQRILEAFGYKLHRRVDRHLEFQADAERTSSLKDLYKPGLSRSIELHIESNSAERPSRLSHAGRVDFYGVSMPVLSPIDFFLGQALHAHKHLRGQLIRTAHLFEFRRHVIARYGDKGFWERLRRQVEGDAKTRTELGFLILVIAKVMGPFAPESLSRWSADHVSPSMRLWVDMYARRAVLADIPGTKLYLLVPNEASAPGAPSMRRLWLESIPRCLPFVITHPARNETTIARIKRYGKQFFYVAQRLRFHFVEGIRHYRDSIVWRRSMNGLPD